MTSFSISLQDCEDESVFTLGCEFELIMDSKFSDTDNFLYTTHVNGFIHRFEIDFQENELKSVSKVFSNRGSCRNIEFIEDKIITTYSTGEIIIIDKLGNPIWKTPKTGVGINAVAYIDNNIIVTGNDEGYVEVWDAREKNKSSIKFRDNEDCVNDLCYVENKSSIIVINGDTLGIYDSRSIIKKKNKDHLISLSDPQEENILCTRAIRNNSKVVCGTDEGNLLFFSWGNFGDCSDRMLIPCLDGFENDNSVEHFQIYQDQFAIISTSDGILKVVEFFPNEILGTLSLESGSNPRNLSVECSKTAISTLNNVIFHTHGLKLDIYNLSMVDEIISKNSSNTCKKKRRKSTIHDDFFRDI
ncbi:WD repeat-containing protein 55 [Cryptosporidium felis]|nr:WD repeat-containing protein 55 [Cryptosporidium felis]